MTETLESAVVEQGKLLRELRFYQKDDQGEKVLFFVQHLNPVALRQGWKWGVEATIELMSAEMEELLQ